MRLAVVVMLAGCHGEPAPRPKPAAVASKPAQHTAYDELEDRLPPILDALAKLGDELHVAGEDCTKLAGALRKFGAAHASELPELGELLGALSPAERERFDDEHASERKQLERVFHDAIPASCGHDPQLQSALEVAGFRPKPAPPSATP